MIKISPSILSADFSILALEIERLTEANADFLHLDIMDGHYVPNLTFGLTIIKRLREITKLPFDIHLMVTNPAQYIEPFAELGGIEYLSYHPETEYHNHKLIHKIKSYGIKAGWAINPAIPVEIIKPVSEDLDFVLLMSVNPGFSGQSFIPSVYDKIKYIRNMYQMNDYSSLSNNAKDKQIEIEVDGGVNSQNAPSLAKAGVDILVAGAYIFNQKNYSEAIQNLRY